MLSASQARYDYFEAKLASRPAMKADRSHLAEQLRARLRKHRKGHVLRLAALNDADFLSRLQIQFENTPLTGVQARPAISGKRPDRIVTLVATKAARRFPPPHRLAPS